MCGRYTVTTKLAKVIQQWPLPADLPGLEKLVPSFNILPSRKVLAVWVGSNGKALTSMRWGFLPPWAKDMAAGYKMINARAETLAEKPSFRKAFREQRCLIIADGFYEWRKVGKEKRPVRIVLKSRELFAFAGLWSPWTNPETKEKTVSCAIVTCEANSLVKQVHDRMPVILGRDQEDAWLDKGLKEPSDLMPMLKPYPADKMELYPVSRLVNAATVDEPGLIEPV